MGRKEDKLNPVIIEIVESWQLREENGPAQHDIEAVLLNEGHMERTHKQVRQELDARGVFTPEIVQLIDGIRQHFHQNVSNRLRRLWHIGYFDRPAKRKLGRTLNYVRTTKKYCPPSLKERVIAKERRRLKEVSPAAVELSDGLTGAWLYDLPEAVLNEQWAKEWIKGLEHLIDKQHTEEWEVQWLASHVQQLFDLDWRINQRLSKARVIQVKLFDTAYMSADSFMWIEADREKRGRSRVHLTGRNYAYRLPKEGGGGYDYEALLALYAYVLQESTALPHSDTNNKLKEEAQNFIKYPTVTLFVGRGSICAHIHSKPDMHSRWGDSTKVGHPS